MTAPTFSADVEAARAQQLQDLRNSLSEVVKEANELRAERNRLADELFSAGENLDDVRARLVSEKTTHEADVKLIGASLIEATNEADYASLYDDLVEGINYRLGVELPQRVRNYLVSINVEVVLTVSATDKNDARENAGSDIRAIERSIDSFELSEASYVTSSVAADYEWDVVNED